ncbi:sulfite exporter TauE/SafE family protein [Nonomuraea sp. NPDC050536]|uniref:urease accessory protein UreH domain-containing protein n=1 Tax=Nonomuraea sp. NPDC050536 TaxID=3364366 RepID=UPI0037C7BC59
MQAIIALLASGLAAGLVAGTVSCTAVQGGLLAGVDGKVGWFLAGRLCSYTLAGALLGWLGSVVRLPPAVRAVFLVVAGIVVIAFAVRLIRRDHVDCPAPTRPGVPVLVGAATILVPCGVTVGMEIVAVSSGSPVGGAAVMAGFVLGSAPAFALLGFLLRRVSRTRLARVAGVVALLAGVWTIGSGLSLGGWLPGPAAPAAATAAGSSATIWATRVGYRPGFVTLRAGVPVTLDFRLVDRGCTGTVTLDGHDYALPSIVRLPPQRPGTLRYVCSMGMYAGFIRFAQ